MLHETQLIGHAARQLYLMEPEKWHRPDHRFAVKSQLTADHMPLYPWGWEVCSLSMSYTFPPVRTRTPSQSRNRTVLRWSLLATRNLLWAWRIIDQVVVGIRQMPREKKTANGSAKTLRETERMLYVK